MSFANELFCLQNIGDDLKSSILIICNNIKNQLIIPDFLLKIFITSIPKKYKSPLNLEYQRGLFLVPKLRVILIKLVYNSIISEIDNNLTNSNIGSQKGKSPRDHLFVVYSVVNETLNSEHQRDIVFYDVSQCYDSLWVKRSLLDMFENGMSSNLLNLVYELSKRAKIVVKTPVGNSEEKDIEEVIMQGETLSGIICTNTMDKMSKDCKIEPLKYKKEVSIPKLGYVDDIADINECGDETVRMNTYTVKEIRERKLQLSTDKCARMHISGKTKNKQTKNNNCKRVHIDKWTVEKKNVGEEIIQEDKYEGKVEIKEVEEYEYLGDIVEASGSNTKNIKKRAAKGFGVIREIKEILERTYFGPFYVEALLLLRNSMLISILTYNLEVSSKISKKDMKILDEVDLKLIRESLSLSSKSPRTLIHAELGIVSVECIIKQNRIIYLHHLLTTSDENLAKQVLLQQIKCENKTDWLQIVKKDLKYFNIKMSFEQISQMSKVKFKQYVKSSGRKAYFLNLMKNKQFLSKGSEIMYNEFKLQTYLKSTSGLTIEKIKQILKIRFRDISLKCNFPNAFGDRNCMAAPLCLGEDSNRHIFSCDYLTTNNEVNNPNIRYEHIFSDNTVFQEIVANIMFTRLEKRKMFMTPANRGPADPRTRKSHSLGIKEARRRKNINHN